MDSVEKKLSFNGWQKMISEFLPALNEQDDSEKIIKFSETALFRIGSLLELMISLADEATEGFQVITDFSQPFYLSLLV